MRQHCDSGELFRKQPLQPLNLNIFFHCHIQMLFHGHRKNVQMHEVSCAWWGEVNANNEV